MSEDRSQDFLLAHDEHFKTLAETIPQIFSLIDPNTFKIKYINKVEPGYSIHDVIGQEIFDYILPEHHEIYRDRIQFVKLTGEKAVLEIGFLSYMTPRGVTWCQTTITAVKDSHGQIESLLILSEDITESKTLEIENTNQSERLKAIINNTNDLICSIDTSYNLIEFNKSLAAIVRNGFQIELQPGMKLLNYIDPEKHDHLIAIYKKVLAGEIIYDIESYRTSNGSPIFIETSFHPIFSADQTVTGISIFAKNITERIKTEQNIKDALKEKEVLLSEIHHRIKNNLAMVSSLLQLKELNIKNEEVKEALSSSRQRIKTTALIHELLYRNETFHDINLKDFITELFDLLKVNESIQLDLAGDDVCLNLTTALPLGLMLNELMMNSFKYSYKDMIAGKTSISLTRDHDILTIDYCDCKGSFPETIDFQNSNTTGLTLIQTFAEQLNGSIELINNKPPKYLIHLPLNESH